MAGTESHLSGYPFDICEGKRDKVEIRLIIKAGSRQTPTFPGIQFLDQVT